MASTIMESLFQRTVEDLVKGLRVQMIGESRYISNHLEEIRREIKSTDPHTKAVALQKLTYINMLQGVDMEWAAFHVIEVMSMTKFEHKKIGYLAASKSFHGEIDVIVLVTNQIRKDLGSTNEYEAGIALECLSCIATHDLAQDLTPEVFALLANGRPYVRKRATLTIFKLFRKYPEAVRVACKRLVEKLEDSDPMVACAAVSVFCEMALKDPRSCIPLAPEFHKLLIDSKNNWLAIKVVKIFGVLAPLEPRLVKKIAEPLCGLLKSTNAKSLLLECIRTIISGLPDHVEAMKLAVEKLKGLLSEENDPNLIYLGLQTLAALMVSHPWAVAENKSIIVRSLNDEDMSIQMASLQLILGMVTDANVIETVQVLMQYAEKSHVLFCNELIGAILATCSRGLYELVPDFTWYVYILGNIARIPSSTHGKEIERQLVDISMRVKEVRPDLLTISRGILLDPALLEHDSLHRILSAVAWIAGEYVVYSTNPVELIEALLQPRTKLLPPSVRAVYLLSVLKVFVYFAYLCLRDTLEKGEIKPVAKSLVASTHLDKGNGQESITSEATLIQSLEKEENEVQKGTDEEVPLPVNEHLNGKVVVNESLERVLDLLDVNVGPLAWCDNDVEVQERACNLLGVVKALKEIKISPEKEGDSLSRDTIEKAFELFDFLKEVFAQDFGPVSIFAQSRVPVPDGLVLEENLDSIDAMFHDEETVKSRSMSEHSQILGEWDMDALGIREASSKTDGSSALLTDHRQRHETFYLPVEKETISTKGDEYPPPQPVKSESVPPPSGPGSEGIMKLAEQPSLWSKTRRTNPRPVIIRLDDSEEALEISSVKPRKDLKDDVIASAIRDVLVGGKSKNSSKGDGKVTSTASHHHRRSHRKGQRSDKNGSSQEFVGVDSIADDGMKMKTHRPKLISSSLTSEGENSKKGRTRQRARSPASLSPQAAVIPDFLL